MDTKYDKTAKQCVNCPGRNDHTTADCPLTVLREWLRGDMPGWDIRPAIRALLSEQPQASAAQSAPQVVKSAPDRIYLVIGAECPDDAEFSSLSEVTWCEDNIDGNGIEYVRAAQSAPAGEREAELVSALDHIAKTCNRSRTSTRRLRWIEQRAKWAIEGKPYDRDAFDLPKDGGSTAHKLSLEVARLKAELAEVQRTQSAGVPDASELQRVIYNADYNAKRLLDADSFWWSEIATIRVEFERYMRAMLAAAPAQPAAHDQGHPMQPVVIAPDGVIRFKQNKIVRHLLDFASPLGCGLNELAREDFSQEDRMQLAQLIGYSVSGYGELSYASSESVERADAIAAALAASTGQEVKP